jgi:hypothetical protein
MQNKRNGVSDNAYQHLQEADTNGDGYVSSEELAMYLEFKRRELEDQDAQRDAMRKMAWFALFGMLLYPVTIIFTSWLDVDDAATIIGDIAPTYFVAIAGLVAAFFGANAYTNSKKNDADVPMPPPPPPRRQSNNSYNPSPEYSQPYTPPQYQSGGTYMTSSGKPAPILQEPEL